MIPADDLAQLLTRALAAASKDATRFHLCGVLLESADPGTIRAVATDGHRLHVAEMPWDGAVTPHVLSRRAVDALLLAMKDRTAVTVTADGKTITVTGWEVSVSVTVGPMDVDFPPWQRVMPPEIRKLVATVDRSKLRTALRKCPRNADGGVTLEVVADGVGITRDTLWVMGPGSGDGSVFPVRGKFTGTAGIKIGINPEYLEDLLAGMPKGDVEVGFDAALDPISIRGADGYRGVVMPMRAS